MHLNIKRIIKQYYPFHATPIFFENNHELFPPLRSAHIHTSANVNILIQSFWNETLLHVYQIRTYWHQPVQVTHKGNFKVTQVNRKFKIKSLTHPDQKKDYTPQQVWIEQKKKKFGLNRFISIPCCPRGTSQIWCGWTSVVSFR